MGFEAFKILLIFMMEAEHKSLKMFDSSLNIIDVYIFWQPLNNFKKNRVFWRSLRVSGLRLGTASVTREM